MALISIGRHRITWSYGHAGVAGSAPGELSNPDDAYLLSRHRMMVADIRNCRVLIVARQHRILRSYGSPSRCYHHPPDSFGSPNGATPLPDGGVLITEIGGWIDRLDRNGNLVYTVRTPTSYPSDAQLLPDGRLLVAGFDTPGRVDILSRSGAVEWTYGPASGPGSLDRPSLAVRWPNGMIAVTDDWHHRIVVIDPKTKRIVWQYGHFGIASSAPGYLSKPDGLDLLPAVARGTTLPRPTPLAPRDRRLAHAGTSRRPPADTGNPCLGRPAAGGQDRCARWSHRQPAPPTRCSREDRPRCGASARFPSPRTTPRRPCSEVGCTSSEAGRRPPSTASSSSTPPAAPRGAPGRSGSRSRTSAPPPSGRRHSWSAATREAHGRPRSSATSRDTCRRSSPAYLRDSAMQASRRSEAVSTWSAESRLAERARRFSPSTRARAACAGSARFRAPSRTRPSSHSAGRST